MVNHSRLQKLGVDFPFLISPMVGISHVAFREWVRSYLPQSVSPLIFTEMLSTRRIPHQNIQTCPFLRTSLNERNFIPQILGNEEQFIAPSLEKIQTLSPWGIDINMGCPMKKTLAHNWGVRLMGDKDYASEVVRVTKRHARVPVSVKLRVGIEDKVNHDYLADFTEGLESAGADWLTVHCRTQAQGRTGDVDWTTITRLKSERSIPIVANGDIQTADDAIRVVDEMNSDGAMIARAATARPWILAQIAHKLNFPFGDSILPPRTPDEEGAEFFRAHYKLCALIEEYFGDGEDAIRRFRFIVSLGHRWLPFGHEYARRIRRAENFQQIRAAITQFSEDHPSPLSARITL